MDFRVKDLEMIWLTIFTMLVIVWASLRKNDQVEPALVLAPLPVAIIPTDREVEHMIATNMLGWGYAASSDTYWLEIGVQMGTASSFRPLSDEYQGNKVISELKLPCTRDNLKEYVLSLTAEEKRSYGLKYGDRQREASGIKYYTVSKDNKLKRITT